MTSNLECGICAYDDNITYVAISPDGSIAATFNPYDSSISIKNVETNKEALISFDRNNFLDKESSNNNVWFLNTFNNYYIRLKNKKQPENIIGWSLAVSDIINITNGTCLVAISCITDKDTNPKEITEIEKDSSRRVYLRIYLILKTRGDSRILLIILLLALYCLFIQTFTYMYTLILSIAVFISILVFILFLPELFYSSKILEEDIEQDRLSRASSEGVIKIFKTSFKNNNDDGNTSINNCGGVVTFLKRSDTSVILVCTNSIKIKKFRIKLNKNISISKGDTYLLPENLFKIFYNTKNAKDKIKNAKINWKYLSKSMYQEFLMINTIDHQKMNIEIYNVSTLQLVNVFYKDDFLISNVNEPGIFAVSINSRLFAFSYGDNAITIYLMESGLEIVSKRFNDIREIKFLKFIEEEKKLLIIEKYEKDNVKFTKFHIWIISGCLNDYFSISNDTLKYEEYYHITTKADGKIVFHNHNNQVEITTIKSEKNDMSTDEHDGHSYNSHDLEPWNNSIETIRGGFLNNDRRFPVITGQNSIQVWKLISRDFENFEEFKNFENSKLVYIFISGNIKPEKVTKFPDMNTVITHACKSLAYLYKHVKSNNSKEILQQFVNGITDIIKDFIKGNPDNWKLMEVQYPLMAYLIYSRSISLIKYILFDANGQTRSQKKNIGMLHRPQKRYDSYPYINDLKLYDDFKFEQDYMKDDDSKPTNDLELALKLKDEPAYGELALEFRQGRDAIILAYLLEYYSENSMTHIGWMINVTKILPKLLNDDYYASYINLLLHKPCFGEMKYNFPIKRFRALSYGYDTLEVYAPLINLISPNSLDILRYKKLKDVISPDIYMVPLPNFTTHKIEKFEKSSFYEEYEKIIHFFRNMFIPPCYNNIDDKKLSSFLQIKKNERAFFNIPAMEAAINSRWDQTKVHWKGSLYLYFMFLILFSSLSHYYLRGYNSIDTSIRTGFGIIIFYYIGIYLLIIEIMQMQKYAKKYITIFNMFDLFSIISGMAIITLILLVKVFNKADGISEELITILTTVTTLILWIEMLLLFRLFSVIAINVFIFGNILKKIIPFFAFMFIFIIGFGHSIFVLFMNPLFHDRNQDNPFDTIWDAILSAYYMSSVDLNIYNYWPLKLFAFIANVIIVLILLNMIIALMNDTFNKAKEDGNLGLLMYRAELIDDFERLDGPSLYNSPYICFRQDPELMKKWISKSQEIKETKLYSWFNESIDKNKINYDNDDIGEKLTPSNEYQVLVSSSIVASSYAPDQFGS
ncbi:uncharacterized protein OCT59_023756 [Rhizophagus irregularis]|uniref:uncharacterized protein n=1 Tax=Rhizophagus irregularis TaxID=588596 RepID=UPI00332AE853|nr:hypothetical protein OCT59_023756 [Rhizophagus irregularis]